MIKKVVRNSVLLNMSASFAIKIVASFFGLILSIMLGRLLGADLIGQYYLIVTVISIGTVIAKLGLDNALLKFISYSFSERNWNQIKGLQINMTRLVLLSSTAISILIYLTANVVAVYIFKDIRIVKYLRIASLSILPLSLLKLHAEMFKGINNIKLGMFYQSAIIPLLTILLIMLTNFVKDINLESIIYIYVITSYLAFIFSKVSWIKRTYKENSLKPDFPLKKLLKYSMPLMWVASLNLVLSYMDTIMMGWYLNTTEVGLYNVSYRIVLLSSSILIAVNGVISQKFSVYWENKYIYRLTRLIQLSTMLLSILSLSIFIFLLIFHRSILLLFGDEFILASNVFIVLAIGQFVVLATGPVASLLMMTGNVRFHKRNVIISSIINFALNLLLIPYFGGLGAALATVSSLVIKNLIAVSYVKKELGISVYSNWNIIVKESWLIYGKNNKV